MKPEALEILSKALNKLPGITKKQANKISYYLVTEKKDEAAELIEAIQRAEDQLHPCQECGNITDKDICYICKDEEKNRLLTLVVVESPLDIYKFEEKTTIRPFYHVLNGLIDIKNPDKIDNLNISNLKTRANKYKEVILALSSNIEGIVTANYIKNLLGDVKVTQLAQGIPLGAAMEYVDELTLKAALKNRKDVK